VKVLLVVDPEQLPALRKEKRPYDTFCLAGASIDELALRIASLDVCTEFDDQLLRYGQLVIDPDRYQARVANRSLDLTYMEYELLRFFVTRPGKVFTREVLLNQVWGYEYYGGARTVDVHVRRLRAKLGDAHANLIQTVRSVGYRFGESRWPHQ